MYWLLRFELLRGDMHKNHPLSRGQLLDDALFNAHFDIIPYRTTLQLMEYLKRESDEVPWRIAGRELRVLMNYLRLTNTFKTFKIFMQSLSRTFYRTQVEEGDGLSREAIRWACASELPQCQKLTHDLFMRFLRKRESMEHLDLIICEGMKTVNEDTYNYIKLSLLNVGKGLEQDLYLTALVCPNNDKFLTESLNVLFRRTSEVAGWLNPTEKSSKLFLMFQESEKGVTALLEFLYIHPTLVLQNLGESLLVSTLQKLSLSLYRRSHQRKLRDVIRYLKLKNTELLFSNIKHKRKWILQHEISVRMILAQQMGTSE